MLCTNFFKKLELNFFLDLEGFLPPLYIQILSHISLCLQLDYQINRKESSCLVANYSLLHFILFLMYMSSSQDL